VGKCVTCNAAADFRKGRLLLRKTTRKPAQLRGDSRQTVDGTDKSQPWGCYCLWQM